MGYFSNGTEGMMYEDRYCSRCVHYKIDEGGCMVWLAHLNGNYKQFDNPDLKIVLDMLIPREKGDVGNKECNMFHAFDPDRCPDTGGLFS